MTTKAEREQKQFEQSEQQRMDRMQQEQDRQTHLVDPLTHPSSGDPPPAISKAGDRLGAVPMTRDAVADHRQAEAEGLEAAEKHEPTKAEKRSAAPKVREAEAKTQTPSHDGTRMSESEKRDVKENEAARNATASSKAGDSKK